MDFSKIYYMAYSGELVLNERGLIEFFFNDVSA